MLSATYRQASAPNAAAAAVDADEPAACGGSRRGGWTAEAVRDAMLAVSGQLNLEVGGPGFRPFAVSVFNSAFYATLADDRAGVPPAHRSTGST